MTWPWEDINKAVEQVAEEIEEQEKTTATSPKAGDAGGSDADEDGGILQQLEETLEWMASHSTTSSGADILGSSDSWQIGNNKFIMGFDPGQGSSPDVVQFVHGHRVLDPPTAGYDIFEWYSYGGFNSNPTAAASSQSGPNPGWLLTPSRPDPELVNGSMTILQNTQLDVDTAESKIDYFPFSASDDMFVDTRNIGSSLIITYTDVEKSLINETFSFPSNMSLTDEMDRIIRERTGNVMKSYNVRRNSFIKTKKAPSLTQINFSSLDISTPITTMSTPSSTSTGRGY